MILNENSSSSQDVMIIEEVPPEVPVMALPKKRGRPRKNQIASRQSLDSSTAEGSQFLIGDVNDKSRSNDGDRPKRTCSRQKSYAPQKKGRGRGRGGND